jgi:hypothetical protein
LQHRHLAPRFQLGDVARERAGVGGVQLEQLEFVAPLQQLLGQKGRARVDLEAAFGVEPSHCVHIVLQHRGQAFDALQADNAMARFAAGFGVIAIQTVQARPRMGVDDGQRRVLASKVFEHGNQHGVLEHIGVIACMKGVAITEHGVDGTLETHA